MVVDKFTYELNGKTVSVTVEKQEEYGNRLIYSLFTEGSHCYLFDNGLKRFLEESPILNSFSDLTAE